MQREFEAAAFGMLISLSTGISQFTYAFGPGLLGLVRDATGGYPAALAVCIALNLTAAAIVLKRPRATTVDPRLASIRRARMPACAQLRQGALDRRGRKP